MFYNRSILFCDCHNEKGCSMVHERTGIVPASRMVRIMQGYF